MLPEHCDLTMDLHLSRKSKMDNIFGKKVDPEIFILDLPDLPFNLSRAFKRKNLISITSESEEGFLIDIKDFLYGNNQCKSVDSYQGDIIWSTSDYNLYTYTYRVPTPTVISWSTISTYNNDSTMSNAINTYNSQNDIVLTSTTNTIQISSTSTSNIVCTSIDNSSSIVYYPYHTKLLRNIEFVRPIKMIPTFAGYTMKENGMYYQCKNCGRRLNSPMEECLCTKYDSEYKKITYYRRDVIKENSDRLIQQMEESNNIIKTLLEQIIDAINYVYREEPEMISELDGSEKFNGRNHIISSGGIISHDFITVRNSNFTI